MANTNIIEDGVITKDNISELVGDYSKRELLGKVIEAQTSANELKKAQVMLDIEKAKTPEVEAMAHAREKTAVRHKFYKEVAKPFTICFCVACGCLTIAVAFFFAWGSEGFWQFMSQR